MSDRPANPIAPIALGDPVAGGWARRFVAGARLAVGGVGFTLRHRQLTLWAMAPVVLQAVLFVVLIAVSWGRMGALAESVAPQPGHWYSVLAPVVKVISAGLLIMAAALATLLAGSVLCDPFYDLLAETTESILLGRELQTPWTLGGVARGMARELGATVWRLGTYLVGVAALLLLGMTGVGSVVSLPLSLVWTWLFIAVEVLSRSQGRHAAIARGRVTAVLRHGAICLGFGAAGWVLSWVPLTTPFLVVGGTRLYLALAAHDHLPSRLTDADRERLRGR